MDQLKLISTLGKLNCCAPQQSKGIGGTGLHKLRRMDTTNTELVSFTSQVFGCSCVCVLPHIKAAGYAEKQRQNTNSLLSLPCRWVKTTFQMQGMGITLPELARRFLAFCGSRKNGLDGIEKVLSALTWEDDAVSFKGFYEEMSFPMWLSRCLSWIYPWVYPGVVGVRQVLLWWPSSPEFCRCDLGEWWEELWGAVTYWGAYLRNPWKGMCFPTVFSFPWLYLKNLSDTHHQCCVSRRYWQTHEPESSCSQRDSVLVFMSQIPKWIFGNPQKSWSPFAVVGGGKERYWRKITLFPLTSWTHQCGFFHGGWVGVGGFFSTEYTLEENQIWWWSWFMSQWSCCIGCVMHQKVERALE